VVSAAIGFRKPATKFFEKVVAIAGCSPREVLFVGDDLENDYEGAIAAGLEAVLLDPRGRSSVPRRIERLSDLLLL
jgi:putative hydrolase of the HAD superfamily